MSFSDSESDDFLSADEGSEYDSESYVESSHSVTGKVASKTKEASVLPCEYEASDNITGEHSKIINISRKSSTVDEDNLISEDDVLEPALAASIIDSENLTEITPIRVSFIDELFDTPPSSISKDKSLTATENDGPSSLGHENKKLISSEFVSHDMNVAAIRDLDNLNNDISEKLCISGKPLNVQEDVSFSTSSSPSTDSSIILKDETTFLHLSGDALSLNSESVRPAKNNTNESVLLSSAGELFDEEMESTADIAPAEILKSNTDIPSTEVVVSSTDIPPIEILESTTDIPYNKILESITDIPSTEILESTTDIPNNEVLEYNTVIPSTEVLELAANIPSNEVIKISNENFTNILNMDEKLEKKELSSAQLPSQDKEEPFIAKPRKTSKIGLKKPRDKLSERMGAKRLGTRISKPLDSISCDSVKQKIPIEKFEPITGKGLKTEDSWENIDSNAVVDFPEKVCIFFLLLKYHLSHIL